MNLLQRIDLKSGNLIFAVIVVQVFTCATIVLDSPVARQVIGFVCLTFVPGIVVLKLLKLKNLGLSETAVLSVGLSVAFLMLAGLTINEICSFIGVSAPLSLVPLMIIINAVVLLLCFLGYVTNREDFRIDVKETKALKLSYVLPIVFLPFLSIAGALLVTASQNNFLLLVMMVAISILIVMSTIFERLVPSKFHIVVLFVIAFALLFHVSLISSYVLGYDVNVEYYCFERTKNSSHWSSTGPQSTYLEYDKVNGMLSVTLLPTIYATILNLSSTWVLKIVYPLIYSFVPVGLYLLYKEQFSKRTAFASTFFFIANSVFFTEMLGLTRQIVAELFFVLLFFVLLNEEIKPLQRNALFIIFSVALALSHYSLSYIFAAYVSLTWFILFFLRRRTGRITASKVVMPFLVQFSWYIYLSASGPFKGLVGMGNHVFSSFSSELFILESRGSDVLSGMGMESAPSVCHLLGRIFAYATQLLIVVGFIFLVARRKKKMVTFEYSILISLSMGILISCIVLPNFAETLRMTRYYHTVLILLAPLCITGGEALFNFFARRRIKTESYILLLILIVLVPYFFFQTGFIYEITGETSWSVPLSKHRMGLISYAMGLIDEQDVLGAIWLSEKTNTERTPIYADDMAKYTVLTSYGMIRRDQTETLSNVTTVQANGAIYLRRMNLIFGVLFERRGDIESVWNITEISPVLGDMNKVYSNGDCEIYKAMSNQTR